MAESTHIIAEMACSHEGDLELAKKIIAGAGDAEADAIQFQIYTLAERVVPHHPEYELLQRLEFSQDQWTELAGMVRSQYPDMQIIACVYETLSVDFAERIQVDAYKIHSADLSNPQLLQYIAGTGKRIDLSVGASSLDEITQAIDCIKSASACPIWLMYGTQYFPTPTSEVHLDYMMKLHRLYELPVGYQDYTDAELEAAFWLPATALGMGISVLEKHITHDRSHHGVDHEVALNPDEFKKFVSLVREIEAAKRITTPKPFTAEELKYRHYAKKSIVAAHDLHAGARIEMSDFKFMFADRMGLPPDYSSRLVGKELRREIPAYDLVTEEDVQ